MSSREAKSRDVVFDLGGVVFRWEPAVLLQELLPERASDEASAQHWVTEIFQAFSPEADWSLFDLGCIEPEALAERISRRTGLRLDEMQRLITGIPPHLVAHQGTVDLIHDLKAQGHRLYFLSNMPAPYADHLQAVNPFFSLFEQGIFSAHVQQIKPLPDIFFTAQTRWPLREAPVFIDDVQHNIEASRRHGWQGVRFESAEQVRADLVRLDYIQA